MSFLHPAMLIGLLGAAVPIIIHLIHKRKPRKQQFAAIEFVLRSVERVERRWRLKRFLLLAARVIVLGALAFAAARPLLGREAKAIAAGHGPERLAIVVDASLSMRARYGGERSAFQRAVSAARNLIDAMGAEDQATIIAARAKPEPLLPKPTASRADLRAALDTLEASFDHAELAQAVTVAAQALAEPEEPAGSAPRPPSTAKARVVVLSDLAGHAIRAAADLTLDSSGKRAVLELVNVVEDVPADHRTNHAITDCTVTNAAGRVARTVEAKVRIRSFSAEKAPKAEPRPTDITLRGPGGDLYSGSVDVVAGTVVDKILSHAFEAPGFVPVQIALQADALAEDDVRYAVADIRQEVRMLIVDGAPSGVPKEDEIFYLDRAIAAGAPDQPPPRVITPDDLSRTDLTGYDVVILAGVTSFSQEDGARLLHFVEAGGGLFITVAQGMDLEQYNTAIGRALPRKFRDFRVVDAGHDVAGSSGVVGLGALQLEHPVMELFRGEAEKGLISAKTRAYAILEPDRDHPAQILAAYDDGQPALLESTLGKGRVMLLTTSIDRDLTDLPIRPAFLPLIRRIILHLGDALSRPEARTTLVSQQRLIKVPAGATHLQVIAPDGKQTDWDHAALAGRPEVPFLDTRLPGHYQVRAGTTGPLEAVASEAFAVNVDTRESDLRPLTVEEATAVLLGTGPDQPDRSAAAAALARLGGGAFGNPETVAAWLLLLMLLAFLLESALTAQRPGH